MCHTAQAWVPTCTCSKAQTWSCSDSLLHGSLTPHCTVVCWLVPLHLGQLQLKGSRSWGTKMSLGAGHVKETWQAALSASAHRPQLPAGFGGQPGAAGGSMGPSPYTEPGSQGISCWGQPAWGAGSMALHSRLWRTCSNCQGSAAAELLYKGRQARSWGWPQCRQCLLQQGTVPELGKQGTVVTGKGKVTNQVSVLEIQTVQACQGAHTAMT